MKDYATPIQGLEHALGGPPVAFNIHIQQNVFVLPQSQGNGRAGYTIQPQHTTCSHPNPSGENNAGVSIAQQAYPNMHHPDRQSLYQRHTTYEAHWPTGMGAMNASYSAAVGDYLGAAAGVPLARGAAAREGYAKANAAEQARQGAAYSGGTKRCL